MIGVSAPRGPLIFILEMATFQFHDRFRTRYSRFATISRETHIAANCGDVVKLGSETFPLTDVLPNLLKLFHVRK